MKPYRQYFAPVLLAASLPALAVQHGQIAPPTVELTDRFGVNLATGQVVQKLETVTIGGDYGLRHHIQLNANHFNTSGGHGYVDAFAGGASYVSAGERGGFFSQDLRGNVQLRIDPASIGPWAHLMRVFGPAGGQDFVVHRNGYVNNARSPVLTSGYTYRPLGDSRHSLTEVSQGGKNYLVWTNPEGIQTRYERGATVAAHVGGRLVDVTYPNGFKVSVAFGAVSTNTGFLLKYQFADSGWGSRSWGGNPYAITGINLAHSHCPSDPAQNCATDGWPTAVFHWPTGSPDVFFVPYQTQNPVFRVLDQHGGTTEYHYQTQNICLYQTLDIALTEDSTCAAKYASRNEKWSPRLVGVKTANSRVLDIAYEYANDGALDPGSSLSSDLNIRLGQWYWNLNAKEGRVTKATSRDLSTGYSKPGSFGIGNTQYGVYREGFGNRVESLAEMPGKLIQVNWKTQGQFLFEQNSRNFLIRYQPVSGPQSQYTYTPRGNLDEIRTNGITVQKSGYADSCTPENFRFCNKPLWVRDAKGQQTDYTYHAESGQVQTATGPAVTLNGVSVRPTTRYEYAQLYAYYKRDSDTVTQAQDPLWLLTSEFQCRRSNASGTGCDAGDLDKIETHYYYGPQDGSPNNLLLRGLSVTAEGAAGVLETRVTCYDYDRAGRKLAETRPKGTTSLTSCP